jgi:hypothetical protein
LDHSIVAAESGRFISWPANNGIWHFADGELLVGFTSSPYLEKSGHNAAGPYIHGLSRSTDGGASWSVEWPDNFVDSDAVDQSPSAVDFTNPDTIIRMIGNGYPTNDDLSHTSGGYFVSHDRGHTWSGLRTLGTLPDHPELAGREFSPRTNYVVHGTTCLMFISTRIVSENRSDIWKSEKVACVRTADGLSFEFLGWVVPKADPYRATMPSGVILADGTIFVAARRRDLDAEPRGGRLDNCWLDGYVSRDRGTTWSFASRVADCGPWNGNPPAVTLTADGRIACVYGNRQRSTIEVVYSRDAGATWSAPTRLRDDFRKDSFGDPDLGYCRVAPGHDGELVATYYWATAERPHQHIAATRWRP